MKAIIIMGFVLTALSSKAQEKYTTDSIYNIRDSVMIKTRDGSFIYTVVVRKKLNVQPLPVLLFFTTYYQGPGDNIFGKRAADRDYVGIVAYSRGIHTDLKNYFPYEHDGNDVYDVIDWISKQPWCNGKVGMYGGSYTGFVQWATAKNIHPALKTIVPQVAVMPGFDAPMENNVPYANVLTWSNDNIYNYKPISRDVYFNWFNNGSSFRSMDSLSGQVNPIFQKWLQHPSYDSYWQSMVPTREEYEKINIPILTTTGYYDGSQISALQYFKLHTAYNANAQHYLVIGPWNHWGGQRNAAADLMGYSIDSVARISMGQLAYQWMDYILKNGKKPEILKDKVNYEVMGTNEWKHVPSLNKMNNDTLTFYLTDEKKDGNYLLFPKPFVSNTFLIQKVDFLDRSDDKQNNYFTPSIIFDTLDASNGVVFMSAPFDSAFTINGSFTGDLFASINKKDMDVSMAFYELMPNGKYFFLTRYVGRASYAKDNTTRHLLIPNIKESIPVNITRMISKKINKGSKLVVLLNINKHPFEIINYGSGKDVNDETISDAGETLQIKWYNDSYIKVPVWK